MLTVLRCFQPKRAKSLRFAPPGLGVSSGSPCCPSKPLAAFLLLQELFPRDAAETMCECLQGWEPLLPYPPVPVPAGNAAPRSQKCVWVSQEGGDERLLPLSHRVLMQKHH